MIQPISIAGGAATAGCLSEDARWPFHGLHHSTTTDTAAPLESKDKGLSKPRTCPWGFSVPTRVSAKDVHSTKVARGRGGHIWLLVKFRMAEAFCGVDVAVF